MSAALAIANAAECNDPDERLSSCPSGITQMHYCGIAVLGKGSESNPVDSDSH